MSSVQMNQMLTEMRLAIAQAKGFERPSAEVGQVNTQFSNVLTDALDKVNDLQQQAGVLQHKFEMNDPNIDLPEVMIAMQKSKVALTAVTEVRNKFVDAYKEIMNMPI